MSVEDTQVVYKYQVFVGDEITIPWGHGTRLTAAIADANSVTFWCVHLSPLTISSKRTIGVVGTGQLFPSWWEVLATSRDDRTGLVWHVVGAVIA